MSEPRTEHQDDPFKELLAGWCGKPWNPMRRGAFNLSWCDHCDESKLTHDFGMARAAVDARHAEEIAAKDRELDAVRRWLAAAEADRDRAISHGQQLGAENATLREQLAAVQQHADELRQYALLMNAHDGRVVSAGADAILAALSSPSTQEPQTVCEPKRKAAEPVNLMEALKKSLEHFPRSPESPNEGAK